MSDDFKPEVLTETIATPADSLPSASAPEPIDPKLVAFISPAQPTIGQVKLRPLRASSLALLRMTKNPLIDGDTSTDLEFHVLAFMYLHAVPIREAQKAAGDPDAFRSAVLDFGETLTIRDFKLAAENIKTMLSQAAEANDFSTDGNHLPPPNA